MSITRRAIPEGVNWEQHFRQMKPNKPSFGAEFGGLLTPDDLQAINQYMIDTPAKTIAAQKIKDDFIKWYDSLGPFSPYQQSTADLARNQRNTFNLANAVTPEEKTAVENVMKTGVSAEQMKGEPDRRDSSGMLPGPTKPPLNVPWYVIAGTAGFVVLIIWLKVSAKAIAIAIPVPH